MLISEGVSLCSGYTGRRDSYMTSLFTRMLSEVLFALWGSLLTAKGGFGCAALIPLGRHWLSAEVPLTHLWIGAETASPPGKAIPARCELEVVTLLFGLAMSFKSSGKFP